LGAAGWKKQIAAGLTDLGDGRGEIVVFEAEVEMAVL